MSKFDFGEVVKDKNGRLATIIAPAVTASGTVYPNYLKWHDTQKEEYRHDYALVKTKEGK